MEKTSIMKHLEKEKSEIIKELESVTKRLTNQGGGYGSPEAWRADNSLYQNLNNKLIHFNEETNNKHMRENNFYSAIASAVVRSVVSKVILLVYSFICR